MYTEAELQQAANSAAAAARREAESKKKEPAPAAPRSEPASPGFNAEEMERAFERKLEFHTALTRTAVENKWTPAIESKIKTLYKAENPTNVTEWLGETAKLFGGGNVSTPSNPAAPSSQPVANPSTPAVPAPIAPSAPSTAVPMERDVDIFTMDATAIHELMRKKGASNPSRPYDPKNRAGRREIRREFESALANRRVRLGSK